MSTELNRAKFMRVTTDLNALKIIEGTKDEQQIFRNLLNLYLYDLSAFEDSDCDSNGQFEYKHLDSYWIDTDRYAFLIEIDKCYAGFILINRYSELSTLNIRSVAEFFVLKKYRRSGIGREAATRVIRKFPGKWEIAQRFNNRPAQIFWATVVHGLVGDKFRSLKIAERNNLIVISFEL